MAKQNRRQRGAAQSRRDRQVWGPWIGYETAPSPMKQYLPGIPAMSFHQDQDPDVIWKNGVLAVMIEETEFLVQIPIPLLHLSFRYEDRRPLHDWRVVQRMKSELCGANTEAVELYPDEERLIDGANQYHIYVFPPKVWIPLGVRTERAVMGQREGIERFKQAGVPESVVTSQQREFGPDGQDVARHAKGVLQELRLYPKWQDWAEQEAE